MAQFFTGSTTDLISEGLQNARRSGASRTAVIAVTDNAGNVQRLTLRDNGEGVSDRDRLLSYGESGWDDAQAQGEDPAGMGMLSFAAHEITVCTERATAAGRRAQRWSVTLGPEEFRGERVAVFRRWAGDGQGPGTSIEVQLDGQVREEDLAQTVWMRSRFDPLAVLYRVEPPDAVLRPFDLQSPWPNEPRVDDAREARDGLTPSQAVAAVTERRSRMQAETGAPKGLSSLPTPVPVTMEPGHFRDNNRAREVTADIMDFEAVIASFSMPDEQDLFPGDATRADESVDAEASPMQTPSAWRERPTESCGVFMPRQDFLEETTMKEFWGGLKIGVRIEGFDGRPRYASCHNLNFHGHTLHVDLPYLVDRASIVYRPVIDVVDCPSLRFVLPARHQVVEDGFAQALRAACRRQLERCAAQAAVASPVHWPYREWVRAHEGERAARSVTPALQRWSRTHASGNPYEVDPGAPAPEDGTLDQKCSAVLARRGPRPVLEPLAGTGPKLVVVDDWANDLATTVERAVSRSPRGETLYAAEPDAEGFEWYDALPRVGQVTLEVMKDARTMGVADTHSLRWFEIGGVYFATAETLHVECKVLRRGVTEVLRFETDVIIDSAPEYPSKVILAIGAKLGVDEFARLMVDGFCYEAIQGRWPRWTTAAPHGLSTSDLVEARPVATAALRGGDRGLARHIRQFFTGNITNELGPADTAWVRATATETQITIHRARGAEADARDD